MQHFTETFLAFLPYLGLPINLLVGLVTVQGPMSPLHYQAFLEGFCENSAELEVNCG